VSSGPLFVFLNGFCHLTQTKSPKMISCCTIHLADIPIGFTRAPFHSCGPTTREEVPLSAPTPSPSLDAAFEDDPSAGSAERLRSSDKKGGALECLLSTGGGNGWRRCRQRRVLMRGVTPRVNMTLPLAGYEREDAADDDAYEHEIHLHQRRRVPTRDVTVDTTQEHAKRHRYA